MQKNGSSVRDKNTRKKVAQVQVLFTEWRRKKDVCIYVDMYIYKCIVVGPWTARVQGTAYLNGRSPQTSHWTSSMTSAILKSKKKWIKIVEIVTLPCEQSVMQSSQHHTPSLARFPWNHKWRAEPSQGIPTSWVTLLQMVCKSLEPIPNRCKRTQAAKNFGATLPTVCEAANVFRATLLTHG